MIFLVSFFDPFAETYWLIEMRDEFLKNTKNMGAFGNLQPVTKIDHFSGMEIFNNQSWF